MLIWPFVSDYLRELFSLAGRRALVTGGSSGIGYAMAEAIGRAGAEVVIVARREAELDKAVHQLEQHGVTASRISADLGDRAAVERVCATAGRIDILVNDAANNIRKPMAELTDDDYEQTIAVNLTAPYLFGQHFGPRMAANGAGDGSSTWAPSRPSARSATAVCTGGQGRHRRTHPVAGRSLVTPGRMRQHDHPRLRADTAHRAGPGRPRRVERARRPSHGRP